MRSRWARAAGVGVLFAALGVAATWPLAAHLTTRVAGTHIDAAYFVWLIAWVRRALVQGTPLWVAPGVNYPEGWHLAFSPLAGAGVALALPFRNPVLGYNIAALASYPLAALGMYEWARRRTGSRAAALWAGLAYSWLPYRTARLLAGHFNLVGVQCLPFFFLAVDALLDRPRRPAQAALLAGLSFGWVALTDPYYLVMTLAVGAVYGAARLAALGRERRAAWRGLALAALIGAPLAGAAMAPYLWVNRHMPLPAGYGVDRPLSYLARWGANPLDFARAPIVHFAWGRPPAPDASWPERELAVGWLPLALGAAGLALARRAGPRAAAVRAAGWAAAAAYVLSLGPCLRWADRVVALPPLRWQPAWLGAAPQSIPLPGALLYLIPFFKGARVSSRYTLYAALFLILLAAWGLAELLRRCPRRAGRWALTAAALCVTAIEFYPGPLPTQAIGPRPVDRWLAEQPLGGVLELPLAACRRGQATLATLTHGKPLLGASNGTPQWFRLHAIVARLPEQEALGELQRLGLRYLLLHTEDDATIRLLGDLESAGLIRRDAPGDIIVLELPLGP